MPPRKRFQHFEMTPAGGWQGGDAHEVEVSKTPFMLNVEEQPSSAYRRKGIAPLALIDDATYDASSMELVNIFP